MRISYIINTASLDPWASASSNEHRSAGYRERYRLLKEQVLPAALEQGFDEIIVAGSFEEGPGYHYIPVAPRCRDRRDALWQREIGARHSTGDVLVFGHDDHKVGEDFAHYIHIEPPAEPWDLLIPRRVHGITGEDMNNGRLGDYCGGHVMVLKRWLWAQVPWTSIDGEYWDKSLTRMWREAGAKIVFADDLTHIDIEASASER